MNSKTIFYKLYKELICILIKSLFFVVKQVKFFARMLIRMFQIIISVTTLPQKEAFEIEKY